MLIHKQKAWNFGTTVPSGILILAHKDLWNNFSLILLKCDLLVGDTLRTCILIKKEKTKQICFESCALKIPSIIIILLGWKLKPYLSSTHQPQELLFPFFITQVSCLPATSSELKKIYIVFRHIKIKKIKQLVYTDSINIYSTTFIAAINM